VILPGGGPQDGGGPATEEPVPKELNWDMWSGQAPLRPFSTSRLKGSSKWWDYGGGIVTNWGHHHMDIAHWGMGSEEVGPTSVEAEGYSPNFGKPGYPDQFLPFAAHLNYPNDVEMWFLSAYNAPSAAEKGAFGSEIERIYGKVPDQIKNYKTEDQDHGVLFIGTKGMIFVGRGRAAGEGIGELEQMPIPENGHMRWRSCLYAHMFNFVTCVRTRQKPISQAAEQHRTVIPCHLTNIALRLGRKLQWDPVREQFVGDDEANAMLSRSQRQPYSIQG
jgi:predicted dehydrogenase